MKMVWLGRDNCFQVYDFIISTFMLCVVSIFYFLHFYIFQYHEHFYVFGFRIKKKTFGKTASRQIYAMDRKFLLFLKNNVL